LYTGIARDVSARLAVHASGKGARYTRGRGPFVLLAQARCQGHGHALRVEMAVKALSRDGKNNVATPRKLGAFARKVTSSAKAKTKTKTAPKPKKPKG
ncbi:MAG: putative endonuclease containing a domain protein, partial [Myxococcaceae bacterium]|nr:putative endonuclease containing a domain protein [Myxococcaceae bacterium]